MAQDTDKIKIKTANTLGGGNDGNDLKNCYFLLTNQAGKYIFFDSTGTPIVTNPMPIPVPLAANTQFTFQLDGHNWWIPNPVAGSEAFSITGTGSSASTSGSWANNDGSQLTQSVGSDPTGESGTFQGQAGQDPEAEDAATAAKA